MSNNPLPLYNLGTIFIWCYWVKLDGFFVLSWLQWCEEFSQICFRVFHIQTDWTVVIQSVCVSSCRECASKTAAPSASEKLMMPYPLDRSGGGFFFFSLSYPMNSRRAVLIFFFLPHSDQNMHCTLSMGSVFPEHRNQRGRRRTVLARRPERLNMWHLENIFLFVPQDRAREFLAWMFSDFRGEM